MHQMFLVACLLVPDLLRSLQRKDNVMGKERKGEKWCEKINPSGRSSAYATSVPWPENCKHTVLQFYNFAYVTYSLHT